MDRLVVRGRSRKRLQINDNACCRGSVDEDSAYLDEADVLGLLTEALTAQVEVILADKTGGVLADAAVPRRKC